MADSLIGGDMLGLIAVLWESWFGPAIREVEEEASRFRESPAGRRPDWKTASVLLVVASALTIHNYMRGPAKVIPVVRFVAQTTGGEQSSESAVRFLEMLDDDNLYSMLWWTGSCLLNYLLWPILLIKVVLRERVRDYGTKLQGVMKGWPIYLIFVAVMFPLVYMFSADPHFQTTYPFYSIDSRDEIDRWFLLAELAYALQFLGLEFFFRGFIVHGTKHRFGVYSVFVMMVPYCMIHFRKPLPECVASILAGIALGLMSLKTRSVWLGAALHISVAWGMDTVSLYRKGFLG